MLALISQSFLQGYWWIIISLLAGLLLFLMFVQGGQSFIFTLPRSDMQRTMIVNTLGRKWEFTFTTLVTFGGAFFASFPLFYSVSFGGAYWLWMTILFSFIIQAVAYEFRSKPSNVFGTKVYDCFLFINGCLGPFLIGVTVATFFTGSDFSLDLFNRVTWGTNWHGIEALANPVNLFLGFAVLFLARILGLLYITSSVDDNELIERSQKAVVVNTVPFLIFFLAFVIIMLAGRGFQVNNASGAVVSVQYFYFHSLISSPVTLLLLLSGVVMVLAGILMNIFKRSPLAIWFTGAGTVIVGMALFFLAGYGHSAFYPSLTHPHDSLTLAKASSSRFTLQTMMYVSFIIPFVLVYIWIAWRAINTKKITAEEMNEDGPVY
jgi:cytochrome bd ubiquinol oxidase subunit II